MTELIDFLNVRLDEDEAVAKGLIGACRSMVREPDFYGVGGPAAEALWQRFSPARVLAEVDAKRKIITAHPLTTNIVSYGGGEHPFGCETCHDWDGVTKGDGYCDTLRLLALPYWDHLHYDEGWKP